MSLEARRVEALQSYRILDTAPHPSFDCVTRAARTAFDTPIALVSLIDETRRWFKACLGLPVRETARDISFCTHAIEQPGVFVVEDTHDDMRFRDNPLVTGAPHMRFYAGAPIIDEEGYALGTLCVIDTRAREFSLRDRELLSELSGCAMNAITLHSQGLLLRRADTLIRRYMGRDLAA
ncbi:MAG: GAF domain-containing protein [Oceanicaulis sp.]